MFKDYVIIAKLIYSIEDIAMKAIGLIKKDMSVKDSKDAIKDIQTNKRIITILQL